MNKKFVYPEFKQSINSLIKDYIDFLKAIKTYSEEKKKECDFFSSFEIRKFLKRKGFISCPLCKTSSEIREKEQIEFTICFVCPWHTSGLEQIPKDDLKETYDMFLCRKYERQTITERIKRLKSWLKLIEKGKK